MKEIWRDDLVCHYIGHDYSTQSKSGNIYLAEYECCHMPGVIGFFENIDEKVNFIQSWSGDKIDTAYARSDAGWKAYMPAKTK